MTQALDVPVQLQTKRLVLRKPLLDDAQALFDTYTSDPDITYYISWHSHLEVEETRSFLAIVLDEWAAGQKFEFVINEKNAPACPIGMIGLHRQGPSAAQFGYVLARPYRGRGYMTEALTHLVNWSLAQPGIWRAQVFCDAENMASSRVIEKSGLAFEGVLKKYFVHPNISPEPRDVRMYAKVR